LAEVRGVGFLDINMHGLILKEKALGFTFPQAFQQEIHLFLGKEVILHAQEDLFELL
jgi:hypothetical protein